MEAPMRMLGGPILLGLTRVSQRRNLTLGAEQEQLLVVNLSGAASLQMQIELLDGHLPIDGDVIKTHAELVCQPSDEIRVQVTGGDAKTAQNRRVKRRKSETANATLRTKRTKEPS